MVKAMTDNNWMAESDAYSLMEAAQVEHDPKRKTAAIKAAKKMIDKKREELAALSGLANAKEKKTGKEKKTDNRLAKLEEDIQKELDRLQDEKTDRSVLGK